MSYYYEAGETVTYRDYETYGKPVKAVVLDCNRDRLKIAYMAVMLNTKIAYRVIREIAYDRIPEHIT